MEPLATIRIWDEKAELRLKVVQLTETRLDVRHNNAAIETLTREDLRSLNFASRNQTTEAHAEESGAVCRVTFTNGDWLTATQVGFDGEQFTLTASFAADPLRVPIEFVQSIARQTGDAAAKRRIDQLLVRGQYRGDAVWLANGDRVDGELARLGPEDCEIITAAGTVQVPARQWRGIALDPGLASLPTSPESWAYVQLANGDRVSATKVEFEADRWRVMTLHGIAFQLATDAVERIDFWGDRAIPLTSLPFEAEYRPYLTSIPPAMRERGVNVTPLAITDQQYGWGVGVWSGTRLRWKLPDGVRRFETLVGIDPAAGDRGSVDFVIRIAGEERLRTGRRTAADDALLLGPIDVQSGQQLELSAEYSDAADLHDLANWCHPVLLK